MNYNMIADEFLMRT